jgi:hypothetical protein
MKAKALSGGESDTVALDIVLAALKACCGGSSSQVKLS